MSIFHDNWKCMEREDNSVMEILSIIDTVSKSLSNGYSLKIFLFALKKKFELREEDKDAECDKFLDCILAVYHKTINI